MAGQAAQTMDNVETVLAAGGMTLADVVRYDVHTTSLQDYFTQGAEQVVKRFAQAGQHPVRRHRLPGGRRSRCPAWRSRSP